MTNIAKHFVALADPTRRKLFEQIAKSAMPAGNLGRGIRVTRPAISQHLKVLREAGLVKVEQQGTKRIYSIDPKGVEAMRAYLDSMWDSALHAFKQAAERKE
jgi:DNA-binding transcriptional ArsR family regulator